MPSRHDEETHMSHDGSTPHRIGGLEDLRNFVTFGATNRIDIVDAQTKKPE